MMPLLEAFLALALTMLSLAMIATALVEFFNRFRRTRASGLKKMLEEFYASELQTFVETELNKAGQALEQHKRDFVQRLTSNPLVSDTQSSWLAKASPKLDQLSTVDFFKRLAHTDIGIEVKRKAETEIDEFVDSISRAYDGFGAAASDLFRRRSQSISFLFGIVVAIVLNVNALVVFNDYLDNPQSTAKAVAQTEVLLASFAQRAPSSQGFASTEELEAHAQSIREQIDSLDSLGVTIGYSSTRTPLKPWQQGRYGEVFAWVLGIVGTGLLIGLGGPFWFDVVRKLNDILQVIRGGTPTAAAASVEATATAEDPMKPHKETFKMSGGAPPLVRAQANLDIANEATAAADRGVKSAAETLKATLDATGDRTEGVLSAAIADAQDSLRIATDARKAAFERKQEAEQCVAACQAFAGLSRRVVNVLSQSGIGSGEMLLQKNQETLQSLPGLGDKGLAEIEQSMAKRGVRLAP